MFIFAPTGNIENASDVHRRVSHKIPTRPFPATAGEGEEKENRRQATEDRKQKSRKQKMRDNAVSAFLPSRTC